MEDQNLLSEMLRKWLEMVADGKMDPWKNVDESDLSQMSPLSKTAKPIDPTHNFTDVSDLYSDASSEEESSTEGDEEEVFGSYGFCYRGYRDEDGLFDSVGTIEFENGDIIQGEFKHGIRNGDAVVMSPRSGISRLIGTYVDGKLQGKGQVVSKKKEIVRGNRA